MSKATDTGIKRCAICDDEVDPGEAIYFPSDGGTRHDYCAGI